MLRALAPCLAVAVVITSSGMLAYDKGAPAWIVHLSIAVAMLVVIPAYIRWDKRHYP